MSEPARLRVASARDLGPQFRDNPVHTPDQHYTPLELAREQLYSTDQPEVHDIVRGFRRVLDSYPGARVMVGEVWPREPRSLRDYLRADECQQAFNFLFLFGPWRADGFRERIEEVESLLGATAWPTYTLSNHDFPRHISRYGGSEARARMAAVMLLAMRGTPFLYYGEEIGMPNVDIPAERRLDPVGRDGERTPMQWSSKRNGGFTIATDAWLPAGDCAVINVARQLGDPRSMLSLYRRMIRLPGPGQTESACFTGTDQLLLGSERFRMLPERLESLWLGDLLRPFRDRMNQMTTADK